MISGEKYGTSVALIRLASVSCKPSVAPQRLPRTGDV
jgi:hypothetical protein